MKIRLLSDLHHEHFDGRRQLPEVEADVVVLAGDIHSALGAWWLTTSVGPSWGRASCSASQSREAWCRAMLCSGVKSPPNQSMQLKSGIDCRASSWAGA